MTTYMLSQQFHAYVEALADFHNRNTEILPVDFCHAIMMVNGNPMQEESYNELFKKRLRGVSAVQAFVQTLVIDESNGKISARIGFRGYFAGQTPVVVYEHNFYELRNGRIAEIWSVRAYSPLRVLRAAVKAAAQE